MAELKELPGSHRAAFAAGAAATPVDPDERIEISIYLKPRDDGAAPAPADASAASPRAALARMRAESHADDIAVVSAFAEQAGLEVVCKEPERRRLCLAGKAADLQAAFGATLHSVEAEGRRLRVRSGALYLPEEVADRVLAVLGLDNRPVATPKIVPHQSAAAAASFLPTEVAQLYAFPPIDASSQCIGIIELGGGYLPADNEQAFAAMKLPVPPIVAVDVDGGTNAPGDPDGADGEVALDIQVCGGAALGAKLAVYFAPNTDKGFADAITQAVHDQANAPSVLSISWGAPETEWTGQAIAAMGAAFQDAAKVGVTVCAASGDGLATDGLKDGELHVDYPAADPFVLGCGGTLLHGSGGTIADESVWNSNGGGTGGGVSTLFPLPDYQAEAGVPPPAGGGAAMRGVPDVAGNADPNSGYRVVIAGKIEVFGGTSAAAPLWAGLFAIVNADRGSPVGQAHAALYAAADAFNDIVTGDNKAGALGFAAAPGWDACTGLGSPIGDRIDGVFTDGPTGGGGSDDGSDDGGGDEDDDMFGNEMAPA